MKIGEAKGWGWCCGVLLGTLLDASSSSATVVISSDPTTNMVCANGVCAPTEQDAVLNVGDLEALLATGAVAVTTTGTDIQASDINVKSKFTWSTGSSLGLDAYSSISISAPISVKGPGGVDFTTNDGGSSGDLAFGQKGNISFRNAASALSINGTAYTLFKGIRELAIAIANNPAGHYALANNYDASKDRTYAKAVIKSTLTGAVQGLGNTISNLSIAGADGQVNIALFANVDSSGAINSLRVTKATVSGKKSSNVGVIAAINYGTIFNSFSSGKIRASAGVFGLVGGLVAGNVGVISDSSAATTVLLSAKAQGTGGDAGGLVGANNGTIEASFGTGSVVISGSAEASPAGGLVGFNDGVIQNCYATGATTVGKVSGSGGLVGENDASVSSSYSTGMVSGGSGSYVGGLIGADSGILSNNYWDTDTSGITDPGQGAGNIPNDPGITAMTTQELQSGLPAGFDPTVWAENSTINGGLPYLVTNPPRN